MNVSSLSKTCLVLSVVLNALGVDARADNTPCEPPSGVVAGCDSGNELIEPIHPTFPGSSGIIGNSQSIVSGGFSEIPGGPPGGNACGNILVCGPGDGTNGTGARLLDLESDLVDGTYALSFTVDASAQQARGDVQYVPFFATEFVAVTTEGSGKNSAKAGGSPSPTGGWITLASERDQSGQMRLSATLDIANYGVTPIRTYVMNGPVEVDVSVRWVNGEAAHYFVAFDDQLIVSYGFHSYFSALPCLEGCTTVPLGNEHRPASISYGNLGSTPFVDTNGGWHGLVELGGLVWEYTVGSGGFGVRK